MHKCFGVHELTSPLRYHQSKPHLLEGKDNMKSIKVILTMECSMAIWVSKAGRNSKLDQFLTKDQRTQRKLLCFVNRLSAELLTV